MADRPSAHKLVCMREQGTADGHRRAALQPRGMTGKRKHKRPTTPACQVSHVVRQCDDGGTCSTT
eukprot:5436668-Alexandrium_andersonii.AAC.1